MARELPGAMAPGFPRQMSPCVRQCACLPHSVALETRMTWRSGRAAVRHVSNVCPPRRARNGVGTGLGSRHLTDHRFEFVHWITSFRSAQPCTGPTRQQRPGRWLPSPPSGPPCPPPLGDHGLGACVSPDRLCNRRVPFVVQDRHEFFRRIFHALGPRLWGDAAEKSGASSGDSGERLSH